MTSTLNDALQIILPDLHPALVAADALQAIVMLARLLPPIHCAGFECRLGKNNLQVDFQQRVLVNRSEPEQLRRHIARSGWLAAPPWLRIDALCAELCNPSSPLYGNVSEFWMEFDIPPSAPVIPIPSLFLSFKRPFPEKLFLEIAAGMPAILGHGPAPASLLSNLRHACRACPEGAGIIEFGLLLARKTEIIRANVGNLPPDQVKSFLEKMRWRGNMGVLVNACQRLSALADRVSLCLDIGAQIYSRIGLECFIDPQTDGRPRWAKLIAELTASGLCTPAKGEALLLWPGYAYPPSRPVPWPAGLMVESLLRPPDRFSVIGRRLSHIKVDLVPEQPAAAKGYFGFGPLWLQPDMAARPDASGPDRNSGISSVQDTGRLTESGEPGLRVALEKGLAFLLAARDSAGWWRDYDTLEGGSDEWVTAYTASAIASLETDCARQAALNAWKLLERRRQSGEGWGYNNRLPADMDVTAWGLRLAYDVGAGTSARAVSARRLLLRHLQPSGGLVSWSEKSCPRRPYFANPSIEGWCSIHTCVTAAAAVENYGRKPRDFLRKQQRPDGSWQGYWWSDDEYATSLAVEALARYGRKEDENRIRAAARWVLGRMQPDGAISSKIHGGESAFTTACGLRILLCNAADSDGWEPIRRAAGWLTDHQKPDGSWPPAAWLRIPPAYALVPDDTTAEVSFFLDNRSMFTTATVVHSLEAARRRLGPA